MSSFYISINLNLSSEVILDELIDTNFSPKIWCTKFDQYANKYDNSLVHYKLVSWLTVVEGYPKAPFLIAATPRCRKGSYSYSEIAPPDSTCD